MTQNFDLETLNDATVYDQDNEKVGTVKEIYLDDQTAEARFATVSTGLFGMKQTFVPLEAARAVADGNLKVPFTKDFIKDAPNIDPDGHLEPSQEREIFEYYGMTGTGAADTKTTADKSRAAGAPAASETGEQAVARDEHLVVDKQEQVAGKARLRKVADTETVGGEVREEEIDVDTDETSRGNRGTDR